MWVKLKDGEHRCITNEFDVADIVEKYCGSELAELIRECQYTNIVEDFNEATDILCDVLEIEDMSERAYERISDVANKTLGYI